MDSCILKAISWNYEEEKPIICIYCGICAKYCPYQVIGLQERGEVF
jgi:ferredoxin